MRKLFNDIYWAVGAEINAASQPSQEREKRNYYVILVLMHSSPLHSCRPTDFFPRLMVMSRMIETVRSHGVIVSIKLEKALRVSSSNVCICVIFCVS